MKFTDLKSTPVKIAAGHYEYRGYVIKKLDRKQGYYGGTAFKPNRWNLVGTGRETETLNFLFEEIDEWLDDPFWRDENGELTGILKDAVCA